jgi:hypothetical protein
VKEDCEAEGSRVVMIASFGTECWASERKKSSTGIIRYHTSRGWISEHRKEPVKDPLVEILDVVSKSDAGHRGSSADSVETANGKDPMFAEMLTVRETACHCLSLVSQSIRQFQTYLVRLTNTASIGNRDDGKGVSHASNVANIVSVCVSSFFSYPLTLLRDGGMPTSYSSFVESGQQSVQTASAASASDSNTSRSPWQHGFDHDSTVDASIGKLDSRTVCLACCSAASNVVINLLKDKHGVYNSNLLGFMVHHRAVDHLVSALTFSMACLLDECKALNSDSSAPRKISVAGLCSYNATVALLHLIKEIAVVITAGLPAMTIQPAPAAALAGADTTSVLALQTEYAFRFSQVLMPIFQKKLVVAGNYPPEVVELWMVIITIILQGLDVINHAKPTASTHRRSVDGDVPPRQQLQSRIPAPPLYRSYRQRSDASDRTNPVEDDPVSSFARLLAQTRQDLAPLGSSNEQNVPAATPPPVPSDASADPANLFANLFALDNLMQQFGLGPPIPVNPASDAARASDRENANTPAVGSAEIAALPSLPSLPDELFLEDDDDEDLRAALQLSMGIAAEAQNAAATEPVQGGEGRAVANDSVADASAIREIAATAASERGEVVPGHEDVGEIDGADEGDQPDSLVRDNDSVSSIGVDDATLSHSTHHADSGRSEMTDLADASESREMEVDVGGPNGISSDASDFELNEDNFGTVVAANSMPSTSVSMFNNSSASLGASASLASSVSEDIRSYSRSHSPSPSSSPSNMSGFSGVSRSISPVSSLTYNTGASSPTTLPAISGSTGLIGGESIASTQQAVVDERKKRRDPSKATVGRSEKQSDRAFDVESRQNQLKQIAQSFDSSFVQNMLELCSNAYTQSFWSDDEMSAYGLIPRLSEWTAAYEPVHVRLQALAGNGPSQGVSCKTELFQLLVDRLEQVGSRTELGSSENLSRELYGVTYCLVSLASSDGTNPVRNQRLLDDSNAVSIARTLLKLLDCDKFLLFDDPSTMLWITPAVMLLNELSAIEKVEPVESPVDDNEHKDENKDEQNSTETLVKKWAERHRRLPLLSDEMKEQILLALIKFVRISVTNGRPWSVVGCQTVVSGICSMLKYPALVDSLLRNDGLSLILRLRLESSQKSDSAVRNNIGSLLLQLVVRAVQTQSDTRRKYCAHIVKLFKDSNEKRISLSTFLQMCTGFLTEDSSNFMEVFCDVVEVTSSRENSECVVKLVEENKLKGAIVKYKRTKEERNRVKSICISLLRQAIMFSGPNGQNVASDDLLFGPTDIFEVLCDCILQHPTLCEELVGVDIDAITGSGESSYASLADWVIQTYFPQDFEGCSDGVKGEINASFRLLVVCSTISRSEVASDSTSSASSRDEVFSALNRHLTGFSSDEEIIDATQLRILRRIASLISCCVCSPNTPNDARKSAPSPGTKTVSIEALAHLVSSGVGQKLLLVLSNVSLAPKEGDNAVGPVVNKILEALENLCKPPLVKYLVNLKKSLAKKGPPADNQPLKEVYDRVVDFVAAENDDSSAGNVAPETEPETGSNGNEVPAAGTDLATTSTSSEALDVRGQQETLQHDMHVPVTIQPFEVVGDEPDNEDDEGEGDDDDDEDGDDDNNDDDEDDGDRVELRAHMQGPIGEEGANDGDGEYFNTTLLPGEEFGSREALLMLQNEFSRMENMLLSEPAPDNASTGLNFVDSRAVEQPTRGAIFSTPPERIRGDTFSMLLSELGADAMEDMDPFGTDPFSDSQAAPYGVIADLRNFVAAAQAADRRSEQEQARGSLQAPLRLDQALRPRFGSYAHPLMQQIQSANERGLAASGRAGQTSSSTARPSSRFLQRSDYADTGSPQESYSSAPRYLSRGLYGYPLQYPASSNQSYPGMEAQDNRAGPYTSRLSTSAAASNTSGQSHTSATPQDSATVSNLFERFVRRYVAAPAPPEAPASQEEQAILGSQLEDISMSDPEASLQLSLPNESVESENSANADGINEDSEASATISAAEIGRPSEAPTAAVATTEPTAVDGNLQTASVEPVVIMELNSQDESSEEVATAGAAVEEAEILHNIVPAESGTDSPSDDVIVDIVPEQGQSQAPEAESQNEQERLSEADMDDELAAAIAASLQPTAVPEGPPAEAQEEPHTAVAAPPTVDPEPAVVPTPVHAIQCPPGYEQDVFYQLPESMQQEIWDQHVESNGSDRQLIEAAGYDYETFTALPDSLRQEILQQARQDQQASTGGGGGGGGGAAAEIDNATFLQSLAPELRAEILLSAEPAFLETLPPELVAEANLLRERAAASWQSRAMAMHRETEIAGSQRSRGQGHEDSDSRHSRPAKQQSKRLHNGHLILPVSPSHYVSSSPNIVIVLMHLLKSTHIPLDNGLVNSILANICKSGKLRSFVTVLLVGLLVENEDLLKTAADMYVTLMHSGDSLPINASSAVCAAKGRFHEKIKTLLPCHNRAFKRFMAVFSSLADNISVTYEVLKERELRCSIDDGDGAALSLTSSSSSSSRVVRKSLFESLVSLCTNTRYYSSSAELGILTTLLCKLTAILEHYEETPGTETNLQPVQHEEFIARIPAVTLEETTLRTLCEVFASDQCSKSVFDDTIKAIWRLAMMRSNAIHLKDQLLEVLGDLIQESKGKLKSVLGRLEDGYANSPRSRSMSYNDNDAAATIKEPSVVAVSTTNGPSSHVPVGDLGSKTHEKFYRSLQTLHQLTKKTGGTFIDLVPFDDLSSYWVIFDRLLELLQKCVGEGDESSGAGASNIAAPNHTNPQVPQNSSTASVVSTPANSARSVTSPTAKLGSSSKNEALITSSVTRLLPVFEAFFLLFAWDILNAKPAETKPLEDATGSKQEEPPGAGSTETTTSETAAAPAAVDEPAPTATAASSSAVVASSPSSGSGSGEEAVSSSGAVTSTPDTATSAPTASNIIAHMAMPGARHRATDAYRSLNLSLASSVMPGSGLEREDSVGRQLHRNRSLRAMNSFNLGKPSSPTNAAISRESSSGSLASLRPAWSASSPVARSQRLLTFVSAHKEVLNMIVRYKPQLLDASLSCLMRVTSLRSYLQFDNKRRYFQDKMAARRAAAASNIYQRAGLHLQLRRDNVFEDSFHQLRGRTAQELQGKLRVTFHGEEGIDAGGLSREWFCVIAREIFNPNYCLFTAAADGATFQPNPLSMINTNHLDYFKFVGRVIGKAICDGQLLDAHFTRSFYKHVVGMTVDYTDIEAVEPEYYKSLKQILDLSLEDLGLELTFSTESHQWGKMEVSPLHSFVLMYADSL